MKGHEQKKNDGNFTEIIAFVCSWTSSGYSKQPIKATIISILYCECANKLSSSSICCGEMGACIVTLGNYITVTEVSEMQHSSASIAYQLK